MDNIAYYNEHAEEFINGSVSADLSGTYAKFLQYIPTGGRILDAGCGSGRDSVHFSALGYDVTAFDGSAAMVEHCRKALGARVTQAAFQSFQTDTRFDGIWACASLLHVPMEDLAGIVRKFTGFLIDGGVFYMSFKMRDADFSKDGRSFTCFTEQGFQEFIDSIDNLKLADHWVSEDARPGRDREFWVNGIIKKEK